jgi:hypothetical protein
MRIGTGVGGGERHGQEAPGDAGGLEKAVVKAQTTFEDLVRLIGPLRVTGWPGEKGR